MSNPDPNAAPAAGGVPSFLDDPASCLNAIANRPPSRELWGMLSGAASSCMKEEESAPLRGLYLQAVAQQLPASDSPAAAGMEAAGSNSSGVEFEVMRAQRLFEVLDAVSLAATKVTPRLEISKSGILRALILHPGFKSDVLTQVQVEFCQMALLAEQYRFAARVLEGSWPRPAATLSVRHILRYFLLRGMIHIGCNDWTMAVRCFWTCLSVPSEVVSSLAIAAWKKLVLVQCLQMEDDDFRSAQEFRLKNLSQQRQTPQQSMSMESMMIEDTYRGGGGAPAASAAPIANGRGPMSLPKAVPNCVSRFLSMASNDKRQQQRGAGGQHAPPAPEEVGHMVQEELGEPSGQQHQQQLQQQRGQQAGAYAALGVRVYMELAYAFVAGDRAQFQSLLDQHNALFQADGNLGLVRQCETAMVNRQIYQMSRIYSVIPLADLASKLKVGSVDTLKQLLQQLSLQKSSASCDGHSKWPSIEVEEDGMVVFSFEEAAVTPDEFRGMIEKSDGASLETSIQELMHLTKMVEKLDVQIAISPMYHALVRRANDAKMGGPRGVEEL